MLERHGATLATQSYASYSGLRFVQCGFCGGEEGSSLVGIGMGGGVRVWFWFRRSSASGSCFYSKTWLQAARDRNHGSSRYEPQTTEEENQ